MEMHLHLNSFHNNDGKESSLFYLIEKICLLVDFFNGIEWKRGYKI